MTWIRKRLDRVRYLWRMALEENNDPKKFAFAVAVGVTVSASPVPPVLGLRSGSAIGGAWITKCNKLTAWLSCHVFAGPLWVLAAMLQVRVGSFLLRRPQPVWGSTTAERLDAARHALLAWWVGGVLISPLFGLVAYLIARPLAAKYFERKARRLEELDKELPEATANVSERSEATANVSERSEATANVSERSQAAANVSERISTPAPAAGSVSNRLSRTSAE